jgi:hypothetical protein
MQCNEKYLESYLNNELDAEQLKLFQSHISECSSCAEQLSVSENINNILGNYQYQPANAGFLYSLRQIQFQEKKKFSIFNLFPKELAFSAAMVVFALYIGVLFSFKTLSIDPNQANDYFEQISLVSIIDF